MHLESDFVVSDGKFTTRFRHVNETSSSILANKQTNFFGMPYDLVKLYAEIIKAKAAL